jgi:hypothetical protein
VKRALIAALGVSIGAILMVASFASAAAPTNGRLVVSNPANRVGTAGNTNISAILAPNTYRTTVYVPAGYRATGGLGAVGNNVGKAHVYVKQADGSRVTLNGQLSVLNASQIANTSCSAVSGDHAAVWALKANQSNGTGTVTFNVYVDSQETNPNMPASAAYSMQFCSGGLGMNITQVDLDLVRMFVNPQARGMYVWRAVYDPASADGKSALASSSTLAASAVPISTLVSLKVNRVKGHIHWVTLTGSVLAAKSPLGHVKVQIFVGRSKVLALNRPKATIKTKADGTFRVTLRLAKGYWYVRAKASTPYLDITPGGGCKSADTDNLSAKGCVDATLAPFVVVSNPLVKLYA